MRRRERNNGINGLLVLVAACVFFFYLFAWQVTRQTLFVPPAPSYDLEEESFFAVEAADGTRLAAFWGPSPGARRTVYFFHGNAEDLGQTRFLLNNYRLQGVNVLSYDYRGYGRSEGSPSEGKAYRDAETVLDHAIAVLGVEPEEVVFHGRSLGGGVAMELARRRPAAGLVLESTFLSAFRVVLPLKWLPGDKFVNAAKADEIDCPVLLIHGKADAVVAVGHSEELAERFPDPEQVRTLFLDGVGHNDMASRAGSTYWAALRAFLGSL